MVVSLKGENDVYIRQAVYHFEGPDLEGNLSRREAEVLSLIGKGYSTKQFASILFISEQTVSKHRKNMLAKTGCNNSTQLFKLAISNGYL
jgi:DNA-binding CsgD family transcriptional regulator